MSTCQASGDEWRCDRPVHNKRTGLCDTHYRQLQVHGAVMPIRPWHRGGQANEDGQIQCVKCLRWLPKAAFSARRDRAGGRRAACKECRGSRVDVFYNLGGGGYDRLLAFQRGACAICGGMEPAGRKFAVDHDHRCCPGAKESCGKCVRGLLCTRCNVMLANARDKVDRLRQAIIYLEAWDAKKEAVCLDPHQRHIYTPGMRVLVEGVVTEFEGGRPYGAVTVAFPASTDPSHMLDGVEAVVPQNLCFVPGVDVYEKES